MTMVALASTSYHRVVDRDIFRISDWQKVVQRTYPLRNVRPELKAIQLTEKNEKRSDKNDRAPLPKDHREYSVKSIIDIHAWDQAKWKGAAYAQYHPSQPPCIAFMFENETGGRKIFERWIERFGRQDQSEEIFLSIIRQLPQQNKHHYCVFVSSDLPKNKAQSNGVVAMACRSLVMTPDNDVNLSRFLESYSRFRAYYLLPSFLRPSGPPEMVFDLSILKRDLKVKNASDITEQDIESMALRNLKYQ
jgi:hypothetical protein